MPDVHRKAKKVIARHRVPQIPIGVSMKALKIMTVIAVVSVEAFSPRETR